MESADRVASVLAKLPNNLEPAALLATFVALLTKGGMDNDTLGHAYYTVYYGYEKPPFSPRASVSTSLLALYSIQKTKPKPKSLRVVEQTEPAVYASAVCDAVLQYDDVIPPDVFCQAIRNVHPHELKNDYYHRDEICGYPFDTYLKKMVNARLQEYFSDNRRLDDVLSGIKKCLCLRMLSNNMYYYRDNPAGLAGLDPAIAKLMQFYTLTGFLHESSEKAFDAHLHMIRKYKQLQNVIEELISPNFKKYANTMSPNIVSIVTVEPAYFEIAIDGLTSRFNQVQDLQAFIQPPRSRARFNPVVAPRMSGKEMIHKMDEYMHPSAARLAFDEGIRFMTVLMTRLDTEKNPENLPELIRELGKLYEITLEPFMVLREARMNTPADDETIFRMMQKMDEYDVQYRPTKTNPMRRYLNKLQLQFRSSPRSPRSPRSPSSPRSRKRKRDKNAGGRTKSKRSKRSKRSKKKLIRK